MKKYIRENTVKSFFGNLVANIIISTIILWNTSGILLNYDNSTFMKNILPPLFFSIVVTSLITFFTLISGRKNGQIALSINPNATWFHKALLNGILTGACFTMITLGLIVLCQNFIENVEIPKIQFIIISALFIAIFASVASIILAKMAAKIK